MQCHAEGVAAAGGGMNRRAVELLVCPSSRQPLEVESVSAEQDAEILDGVLVDSARRHRWPVRQGIPRFVSHQGYTASFGEQWTRYRQTQLDRVNGTTLSRDRLVQGTGWRFEQLKGQRVLEVGCGAGRFTEVLLAAGAEVYAIDYSRAVDACWDNNAPHERLVVAQADLYALPFQPGMFDKVLCYGVLQHTPDVQRAFLSLVPFLAPGGQIAIDVYKKAKGLGRITRWGSKYWWRPLTRRLPPAWLARWVEWYIPWWLPIDTLLQRIPGLGRYLVSIVPCWNYTGKLPLSPQQVKAWAILDTFDALSAYYDSPQSMADVESWFQHAGLVDAEIRGGSNGIVGNGRKPPVGTNGHATQHSHALSHA